MKVLLTGASSFTGCWFADTLAARGHQVVATFTAPGPDSYSDPLRRRRVDRVLRGCEPLWNCRFGDDAFVAALAGGGFDLLAHHGAYVTDYRNPEFDFAAAVASNTRNVRSVLETAKSSGVRQFLITGSVFEGAEGAGDAGLPHFSPYGLSKALTATTLEYFAQEAGLPLGKFVIPNPFGPNEEARFTHYLVKNWLAGETPGVRTPAYVRDNIHVSLLATVYAGFAESMTTEPLQRYAPSGYVESQGAFTLRFAREMAPRLGVECPVDLAHQTEFPEPRIRINTDDASRYAQDWDEAAAWDALGDYYLRLLRGDG